MTKINQAFLFCPFYFKKGISKKVGESISRRGVEMGIEKNEKDAG